MFNEFVVCVVSAFQRRRLHIQHDVRRYTRNSWRRNAFYVQLSWLVLNFALRDFESGVPSAELTSFRSRRA